MIYSIPLIIADSALLIELLILTKLKIKYYRNNTKEIKNNIQMIII